MPRIARAVASGFPHHVVQRGNNKQLIFFSDKDRSVFRDLLTRYSKKWNCAVLCYCLMDNHIHLLVQPESATSLAKFMQGLSLVYTQYFNRTWERSGRLWECRYYSCIVQSDEYLQAAVRYIESNPVRSGMVQHPRDYPHSSARAHADLTPDPVLTMDLFQLMPQRQYLSVIHLPESHDLLSLIRRQTRAGRPLCPDTFLPALQDRLGKILRPRPKGRPRTPPPTK